MDFRQLLRDARDHGQTLRDVAQVKDVPLLPPKETPPTVCPPERE